MKRLFASIVFAVASIAAWAMPSPRDIEGAIQAQNYSSAKAMVQEVLSANPSSARAHLLNAYILVHADHNPGAAAAELSTALRLDMKGDVKNSALFGKTAAEIQAPVPQYRPAPQYQPPPVQQAPRQAYVQPQPESSGHPVLWTLLFILAVGGGLFFFLRRKETVVHTSYTPRSSADTYSGVTSPAPQPMYSGHSLTPNWQPSPSTIVVHDNSGMGVGGAVAAGVGGALATELLIDSMERRADREAERRRHDYDRVPSYGSTPASTTPITQLDYETERQALSSGSDNDWTPSPSPSVSSSSDDDNRWSSSPSPSPSSDYSSSSSSDSSSSWSDSSSSSSSSDW
jgi:hypothetical protein